MGKDLLEGRALELGIAMETVVAQLATLELIGVVALGNIAFLLGVVVPGLGLHEEAVVLVLQVEVTYGFDHG